MISFKRLLWIFFLIIGLAFPMPVHAQDVLPPVDTTANPEIEMLAAIVVTSTADTQANDGACTLREAILNALGDNQSGSTDCAAGNGNDKITFSVSLPAAITLSSALPNITSYTFIQGPGADQLSISGNNTVRIFVVPDGGTLRLQGVTLMGGIGTNGGAIRNQGNLNVLDCTFRQNTGTSSSGAVYIENPGIATITGSDFISNSSGNAGGAIGNYNGGTLSVINSTFSGNSTGAYGGGAIYNKALSSVLNVTSSTFYGNLASGSGTGAAVGNGGNSENGGSTTLQNNVFSANLANGSLQNCHNETGTLADGGYNLEDGNSCGFSGTSLISTEPFLYPLGNYGGKTSTHALRIGSPAIDIIPSGVNGCGTTLTTDQRGVARPLDGNGDGADACDAGAYESDQQIGPVFTVNQTHDLPGVCSPDSCTLRQAITNAQLLPSSGDYEIHFYLPDPSTIILSDVLPIITHHLTIEGFSPARITISGNHSVQIFRVDTTGTLDLRNLTLADGFRPNNGGAIFNMGYLTVEYCIFTGNTSTVTSGAIYNYSNASALIRSSAFISNSSSNAGGAIGNYNGATLNVINSTFSGNSTGAWGGGAIYNRNVTSSMEIVNSTFVNNTASGFTVGGAIGNGGAGEDGGSVLLKNNLLAANLANGALQNCYNQSGSSITDGGYNLENGNSCGFSGTSQINTNPLIRGLTDNGGTTPTHALRLGSPAIDRIPAGTNACGSLVLTDQRGVDRPLDGNGDGEAACDVGAYESDQQPGPTFTVNQTGDEDGFCLQTSCTLRQAITSAQLLPSSGDYEIDFDLPAPSAIVLGSTLPIITHHLTIEGISPARITISGNDAVRMFTIESTGTLDLRSLTLADGHTNENGGAILNMGYLTAEYCIFTGNTSAASSGVLFNFGSASALFRSSTFSGNSSFSAGGAIGNYNGSTLNVINSTFSGNSTGVWGGGAIFSNGTTNYMEIISSTFVNNTASGPTVGGAIGNGGNGDPGGSVLLKNNLLVANLANGALQNCYNQSGSTTDGGYNLENGNSCGFSGTSLINTNPLIRGLADNGGPTPTHALRSGSPAIDRIPYGTNGCGSLVLTDQRGVTRPRAGSNNGSYSCDIGAYEAINQVYLPLIAK